MAQLVESSSGMQSPVKGLLEPIQKKVELGRKDRARFEAVIHSNRAFAAGKHWLRTTRSDRRLVLDKRDVEGGKQRVTIDLLSQYLNTALSQLRGIEDRPQLLFRRNDLPSEDFTQTANNALQYGWDSEWEAKRQIERTKRRLIVDGTAAIQCVFDPTVGADIGEVPIGDGEPYALPSVEGDPRMIPTTAGQPVHENAGHYVASRVEQGLNVTFKRLNEGRICWKPRSFFNLITPPGQEDEDEFQWEAVISAAAIDDLIARYGDRAKGLKSEPLAALEVIGLKDVGEFGGLGTEEEDYGTPGKLEGHVALIEYFERSTTEYPKGRVVTYARDILLEIREELPYRRPNGDWSSGIAYFHYWRVEGRFWGRGLIEPGKGIQRTYNKRCAQEQLTIDRGQPYVLAEENSEVKKNTGTPMEIVRYRAGTTPPQPQPGMAVGPWMWESKQGLIDDLDRAMGQHGISRGEEPGRETTYAELAMRAEKDRSKTDPITERLQNGKNRLVEFSVWDMRRYWTREKVIALVGEDGEAEAVEFSANDLPEYFLLKTAEGSKPRDQASEIQLIFDLYNQAQLVQTPLPIHWLKDSVDAGKALPLPEIPADVHLKKATWENAQMWEGKLPEPKDYDPPEIHVPAHREAQVEAEMAGRMDVVQLIGQHLQMSEELAMAVLERQRVKMEVSHPGVPLPEAPAPPPEEPGAPTSGAGGGSSAPRTGDNAGPNVPQEQGGSGPSDGSPSINLPFSINVPEPKVTQTVVPGKAPIVNIDSELTVGDRQVTFKRDKDGRIESANVTEKKKKGKR